MLQPDPYIFSYQSENKENKENKESVAGRQSADSTESSCSGNSYVEIGSDDSVVTENSVVSIYSARADCMCGMCALLTYILCMAAFISALYSAE